MKTFLKFALVLFLALLCSDKAHAQCSAFAYSQVYGQVQTCTVGSAVSQGQILSLNSSNQVIPIPTSSTGGIFGVALQSGSTGSQILILITGQGGVSTDNACTVGQNIIPSTSTAGNGHCTSSPGTTQFVGTATVATAAAGSTQAQVSPLSSGQAGSGGGGGGFPASLSGPVGSIFNCVNQYSAVGDGSTDNTTALGNCATAVNGYTQHPSQAQGLTDLPTMYLPPGKYNLSGGITLTSPAILRCEQGAVLNFTGTGNSNGNAVELGTASLSSTTYQTTYFIIGCSFTGGANLTHVGLQVNNLVLMPRIWQCRFINFGNNASTFWKIQFGISGEVDDPNVEDSYFWDADNVARNGVKVSTCNGCISNQLRFINNYMSAAMAPGVLNSGGGHAAQNAGIGLFVDGLNSIVTGGIIQWMQPDIQVGSNCKGCRIQNINFESSQTANTGQIQFGDPTGGNCPTCAVDGLTLESLESDSHNTDFSTTGTLLQPTTANSLLTNASLKNISLISQSATIPVVSLNNLTGQIGTSFENILSSTGAGPLTPTALIASSGSNLSPAVGISAEGTTNLNPTLGFACSQSASTNACDIRFQNKSSVAGLSFMRLTLDTGIDSQPFGTTAARGGFIQHTGGSGGGTKIGDWEALPVQVLTSPTAGTIGLHTVFLPQGGQADEGTTFAISGCSVSAHVGGAAMGQYTSGTTGTCTVAITPGSTAPHAWTCWANDLSTPADLQHETAATSSTVIWISGTTVSGDVVNFGCTAY